MKLDLTNGATRRSTWLLVLALAMTALASGSPATAGAQPVASQPLASQPPDTPESASARRAAALAGPATGSRSALVITVILKATADTPETVPDKTAAQVATNAITNTRPWFQGLSHGVFSGYFALSRGPVTVQTTAPRCSAAWSAQIGDQADAAVRLHEPNLDPSSYSAVVYYFGHVDCNFAGGAILGGRRVWLNGDTDLRTVVHELGHNMGLSHSGSQSCIANGAPVPLSSTCTDYEYGDVYSAMGERLSDRYSPSQMEQLGWYDGRVRTVTASDPTARYMLTPAEANGEGTTQALHVVDGATTLWLEYRLNPAFGFTSGLLVRREQPTGSPLAGAAALLFMNQETGPLPYTHPTLNVGQTWANPLGTLQITLDSADATGAGVTIRSAAVQPKTVPDVRGQSVSIAKRDITAAGLVVGSVGTLVDANCDRINVVITQTPAPGTRLPAGSAVGFSYGVRPSRGCPISPF